MNPNPRTISIGLVVLACIVAGLLTAAYLDARETQQALLDSNRRLLHRLDRENAARAEAARHVLRRIHKDLRSQNQKSNRRLDRQLALIRKLFEIHDPGAFPGGGADQSQQPGGDGNKPKPPDKKPNPPTKPPNKPPNDPPPNPPDCIEVPPLPPICP